MKRNEFKVIYIAGNGHSGSTLLSIVLGNSSNLFNAGELTNITREFIFEEYCSCNQKIKECDQWSEIIKLWNSKREISLEEYRQLRYRFERNKSFIVLFLHRLFSSSKLKKYRLATFQLFQAINTVTGATTIIDSSKSAQRIAILKRIVDLKVVHLCRNFKGVLNSAKKSYLKNIQAGIEKDIPARKTKNTLRDWLLNNIMIELQCIGKKSLKIKYKDLVQRPENLKTIGKDLNNIDHNHCFNAKHMFAGNILRLKKDITINPQLGFTYNRLTPNQLTFAKLIDTIFWYWS